jgi:peroxiredoxin family protein
MLVLVKNMLRESWEKKEKIKLKKMMKKIMKKNKKNKIGALRNNKKKMA